MLCYNSFNSICPFWRSCTRKSFSCIICIGIKNKSFYYFNFTRFWTWRRNRNYYIWSNWNSWSMMKWIMKIIDYCNFPNRSFTYLNCFNCMNNCICCCCLYNNWSNARIKLVYLKYKCFSNWFITKCYWYV